MAIMETNETVSKSGFRKKIDAESQEVILNIVQVALYQFPYKSMVREIVSNAVDSVKEKESARLILTGAAKVSDYYVEMEGDIYKNSQFNPKYYELNHLSPDNTVYIKYIVNSDISGRDTLVIKDMGVGLGGTRLEKFFMPGASSKRLNKQALGKFGIGNKSPLSTGAESYKLVSYYNGKRFEFDIREDKIDSSVPRFKDDGSENPFVVFEDTYDMHDELMKVYYTPTTEKNSVEIVVEIKKHNKNLVEEAVKSQLMYFKEDISFVEMKDGQSRHIDFKSPILLENEDVILPVNTSYYSKPHFILNNVCYGLIDFREMELNPRFGCIGIKFELGDIDVNPSRESVAYTSKTKAAILAQYSKITKVVEEQIQKELTATDPLEWMSAANSIMHTSNASSNQVLNRLSNLIDKKELRPKFTSNGTTMSYKYDIKEMLGKYLVFDVHSVQGYGPNAKVKRDTLDTLSGIDFKKLFYRDISSVPLTNAYLCSLHGKFYCYRLDVPAEHKVACNDYVAGSIDATELKTLLGLTDTDKDKIALRDYLKSLDILKMLLTSKMVQQYSSVAVPESYSDSYKNSPAVVGTLTSAQKAQARKSVGQFLYGSIRSRGSYSEQFVFSPVTAAMTDLHEEIYYGHNADTEALISLMKLLRTEHGLSNTDFGDGDPNLSHISGKYSVVKVAQNLKKNFKIHTHVSEFGFWIEDGKLNFDPLLQPYIAQECVRRILPNYTNALSTVAVLYYIDPKYKTFLNSTQRKPQSLHGLTVENLLNSAIKYALGLETDLNKLFTQEQLKQMPNGIDLDCSELKDMLSEIRELTDVYHMDFKRLFEFAIEYAPSNLNSEDKKLIGEYLPMVLNTKRYKLTNDYENLF